ncbi:MAG: TIGR03905 family TSCPD domain-containing protein [Ruminococcus sp.]|nr:TIGR03905 family TSCPD domain-containing protein [Ruminococcus sp.]
MRYSYKTSMVCASRIDFDLEGSVVRNVQFTGGCNGNLKAVSKLVEGMTVDKIEEILGGNTCNNKPTSCADQLAKAVRAAYDHQAAQ